MLTYSFPRNYITFGSSAQFLAVFWWNKFKMATFALPESFGLGDARSLMACSRSKEF